MIRSKQPEIYYPLRRKSGILYLQATDRKEDQEAGTVEFKIRFFTPQTITKKAFVQNEVTNEDGSKFVESREVTVQQTILKELPSEKSTFRFSTFYNLKELRTITPEQYDQALIDQIDRVNKLTQTGKEIQPDFYFYEWTKNDLEIVSEQDLIELMTPQIIE